MGAGIVKPNEKTRNVKVKKVKVKTKKLLVTKEAKVLLRKQYLAEKEKRKPEQQERGPVNFATDRMEQAARSGTVLLVKKAANSSRYRKKVVPVQSDKQEAGQEQLQAGKQENGKERPERVFAPKEVSKRADMETVDTAKQHLDAPDALKQPPSELALRQKQRSAYQQKELLHSQKIRTLGEKEQSRQVKSREFVAELDAQKLGQPQAAFKTKQYIQQMQLTQTERERKATAGSDVGAGQSIEKKKPKAMWARQPELGVPDFVMKQNQDFFVQAKKMPAHLQTTRIAAEPTTPVKQFAQKRMQQKLLQVRVQQRQHLRFTLPQVVRDISVSTVRGVLGAAHTLFVASGGVIVLVAVLLIAMLAMVAASPFGIFFSTNEIAEPGTMSISAAIGAVNQAFSDKLEALQTADSYKDIQIDGAAADFAEVIAVFAAKVTGNEQATAADVITIDETKLAELQAVFWDMTKLQTEVITQSTVIDGKERTEKILQITISKKSAEEMAAIYGFTTRQKKALEELLSQKKLLTGLIGSVGLIGADAGALLENLPEHLSAERKKVVQEAASLVGKVNYFWGGKSLTLGWNSAWGELRKVTAAGSPSTGTYRPYGLDCSGFVDWVFYNATGGSYVIGQGGGVKSQRASCDMISWHEALPGDLVFYADNSHIGIVSGRDANGKLQIIQCASGANNVVITGVGKFAAVGRPRCFAKGEKIYE